jgi:hypothetical protein
MNSMLSELLPVCDFYKNNYETQIQNGKNLLPNKKITILCLARNIENKLYKNVVSTIDFFESYSARVNFVIYENDSVDNTKMVLNNLKQKYPAKIEFIAENLNKKYFGPIKSEERIKALSEYRNRLKDHARSLNSDFIIVLDLDFEEINFDGLLNSFGWLSVDNKISAVAGNSFEYKQGLSKDDPARYNLWNYDSWAFRQNWWLDLDALPPAPNNSVIPMLWFGLCIYPTGTNPIVVNSAFGGCCIYRSEIYFKGHYDYKDCEHVCFHYSLYSNKDNNFRLILNPSQQMLFI